MKAIRNLAVSLAVLAGAGLAWNQWRLHQAVQRVQASPPAKAPTDAVETLENADARLRQAEARYQEAEVQLRIAGQKLADANARISQLENRLRQLETGRSSIDVQSQTTGALPSIANRVRRAWGPEQAAGAPDTFQAGDISTAWASREQNAGEEWLKLDYESPVDIAEVRVRETHHPGALSKITALLPNGNEVVLWEGVEPAAEAPVEMSFQIPVAVNAKTVKVYLDTSRVPGWNEIDAVELIGRDGSRQWASQVSASSTYAEPRVARGRTLEEF